MGGADRIAFVCPRLAGEDAVGGAETLLRRLAERAAASGRAVDFLTTCARNHFTWANELPAGRQRIGLLDVHAFPVDGDRDPARFAALQQALSAGAELSDAEEEDWLRHGVSSRALLDHLAGAAYRRVVAGPYLFGLVRDAVALGPERARLIPCLHDEPFAYCRVIRRMFESAGGLLFNTEPERDLALRLYRLRPERCRVVGLGMDPFDADPRAFAARRGLRRPYVFYCGRREAMKGTPMLADYVHAFRRRTGRDVMLVLAGSGPVEAPPGLAPHLLDAGFLSEAEKREAMAGAVAFCHPSRHESLGIVLLEAWLAGAPCLVNAHGNVLPHQCRAAGGGLWFHTYPEFEAQLDLLLRRPDLRDALGRGGRAFVLREYNWERVEHRFLEALDAGA